MTVNELSNALKYAVIPSKLEHAASLTSTVKVANIATVHVVCPELPLRFQAFLTKPFKHTSDGRIMMLRQLFFNDAANEEYNEPPAHQDDKKESKMTKLQQPIFLLEFTRKWGLAD